MDVEKPVTLDLLDTSGVPALSSTNDMPVVETKPDATNEGKPPALDTPAAAPDEGAQQPEESATSATEEAPAEPAKKESRGVQKALDRLTAEREEQKRRAEAAEERLDRALAALEQTTGKPAAEGKQAADTDNPAPVKPDKQEFTDPDAYEAALEKFYDERAQWTVRKELQAKQAEEAERAQKEAIEQQQKVILEAHTKRVEAAKAKYADFDESLAGVEVPGLAGIAMQHSEQGVEMMYHYAKHPEEAKALFNLSPPLMIMELGRLAERLAAPQRPTISAAPPPINSRRPSSVPQAKSPEDETMEEYAARRQKELRESRTRH